MAKTPYKGRGGFRGGVRPTLNHVRRMVPEYVTQEWIEETKFQLAQFEQICIVVSAWKAEHGNSTQRNAVYLKRLITELEQQTDIKF